MPNSNSVNLIAIQARIDAKDYCDAKNFEDRVDQLCEKAVAGVDRQLPTLVCFPELFALPLLFELGAEQPSEGSTFSFVTGQLRSKWRQAISSAFRYRSFGMKSLLLANALEAHKLYHQAFSGAARKVGAYVLAGSIFLPPVEFEVSAGTFLSSTRVHHSCSIFNPEGKEIGKFRKLHLTPGMEKWLLSPAPQETLTTVPTGFGRLGVLICFDAFFDSLVRWMDNQGVQILVQPSANDGWENPWKHNRRLGTNYTEAEVWMQFGVIPGIQERECIRYCVNPMLVGPYAGMEFFGRSSIGANKKLTGREALVAQAKTDREEEIIAATVELS